MNSRTARGLRQTLPRPTRRPDRSKRRFISDLRFMRAMSEFLMPGMLKSVRSRASVSSQYSFSESMRSILP